MYANFERFTLQMTKAQALAACHAGNCDAEVKALCATPSIRRQLDKLDPAQIIAELSEYGAWEPKELADDVANRRRIVWLAAGNIREELARKGKK